MLRLPSSGLARPAVCPRAGALFSFSRGRPAEEQPCTTCEHSALPPPASSPSLPTGGHAEKGECVVSTISCGLGTLARPPSPLLPLSLSLSQSFLLRERGVRVKGRYDSRHGRWAASAASSKKKRDPSRTQQPPSPACQALAEREAVRKEGHQQRPPGWQPQS